MLFRFFFLGLFICILPFFTFSQSLSTGQELRYNPISTAVPFLTITPDSRHGAMGNTGVATSPDANAQYINASKYAFLEDKFGFSVSYIPWLRKLTNDINLAYLSGFYRLDNEQAIASSLKYFSIGDVTLTGNDRTILGIVNPNEFAFDFSYSRKLSDLLSGGVTLRYIRTDLSGGYGEGAYYPGNAFATDVSFFYNKSWTGTRAENTFAMGLSFTNIGSKVSYNEGQTRQFLPANLGFGTAITHEFNSNSSLTLTLDLNKLLVPTPSYNTLDEQSGVVALPNNHSSSTVIEGIFTSFSDAPGGIREELQEIIISGGFEYLFSKRFALRGGYLNESKYKGNRKFFTGGGGVKMNVCSLDFSYLVPIAQNSPLGNTIRLTITFDSNSFKNAKKNNLENNINK